MDIQAFASRSTEALQNGSATNECGVQTVHQIRALPETAQDLTRSSSRASVIATCHGCSFSDSPLWRQRANGVPRRSSGLCWKMLEDGRCLVLSLDYWFDMSWPMAQWPTSQVRRQPPCSGSFACLKNILVLGIALVTLLNLQWQGSKIVLPSPCWSCGTFEHRSLHKIWLRKNHNSGTATMV